MAPTSDIKSDRSIIQETQTSLDQETLPGAPEEERESSSLSEHSQLEPLVPSYSSEHEATTDDPGTNNDESQLRKGTLTSATFNILSTMVGGGSLSVPLAFHQAGNAFLGPLILIFIAFLVKNSVHLLVNSAILSHPEDNKPDQYKFKGSKSFESVACHAFGPKAKNFTMGLLSTICFFTIVGYAVLLRDMLLPLSNVIFGSGSEDTAGPTFHHNITMLTVIFLVTPLCTLRDLTPLEKAGAVSMVSLLMVACCITYRSIQCNFSPSYDDKRLMEWHEYMNYVPETKQGIGVAFHDLLNSLPILLSVFMCHFNVLPVHNELAKPTQKRVKTLFSTSIWGACLFYLFVGFSGSMYGNCTPNGVVEGNVLLSFEEDDVLLMLGKLCLSLTITAAFPVLVVPCRDVILRALVNNAETEGGNEEVDHGEDEQVNDLAEPLLDESSEDPIAVENENAFQRKLVSVIIFWSAATVACCVGSIDIVWDILGGSLSLIMGFILPSTSYIVISRLLYGSSEGCDEENGVEEESNMSMNMKPSREFACFIFLLFIPIMTILTGNAILKLA